MSAAAEYELEQVLLERQRARAAMYREQQQQQGGGGAPPSRQQGGGGSPTMMMMGSGSERSLGTVGTSLSGPGPHRFPGSGVSNNNSPNVDNNGTGVASVSPNSLANTTNSVVTAALETLQREGGEYGELDMSPREAMLRAVLHKRQQQRNQQQQPRTAVGNGPPRYEAGPPPPPPVHYYR
jgi:hypothetical protein